MLIMADRISREDKYRTWKCIECGSRDTFHKDSYKQDGIQCQDCKGTMVIEKTCRFPPPPQPRKTGSAGTLTIDVDVSNALTGLKAVQREAKKATAALKEFEQAFMSVKSVAEQCGVSGKELFSILNRPEISG